MACGLPIISSDLPFNDEILDDTCSIRIDPMNIEQIKNAILLLKGNDVLRLKMSKASLEKAKNMSLATRADRILCWLDEKAMTDSNQIKKDDCKDAKRS